MENMTGIPYLGASTPHSVPIQSRQELISWFKSLNGRERRGEGAGDREEETFLRKII